MNTVDTFHFNSVPKPQYFFYISYYFQVVNIDQEGNDHLPGRIEVTSEYLILYQGKKQTIQWPIRTLRRYGFECNIFSFEAGRRCPTGEGIFAFRCVQAEQLFRLLQANIQVIRLYLQLNRELNETYRVIYILQRGCNITNVSHGDISQNNYLEPRAVNVRHCRLESVGSSSSCPHTPVSPAQTSVYNFDEKDLNARSELVTIPKNSATSSPLYINVETGLDDDGKASSSQNPYICFPEKLGKHYIELGSSTDEGQDEQSPKNKLLYISVDVNEKPSSPVVKTPTKESKVSVGYTTIDFQRTWALFQSTKPNIENDIGCRRRTRHNSNLFGVHR